MLEVPRLQRHFVPKGGTRSGSFDSAAANHPAKSPAYRTAPLASRLPRPAAMQAMAVTGSDRSDDWAGIHMQAAARSGGSPSGRSGAVAEISLVSISQPAIIAGDRGAAAILGGGEQQGGQAGLSSRSRCHSS